MVSVDFVESQSFAECTPKERFELLFGERQEVSVKSDPGMLWITLSQAYLGKLHASRVAKEWYAFVDRTLRRFTETRRLWNARVKEITQLDMQEYVDARSSALWSPPGTKGPGKPLSSITINNEIAVLNSVFSYAGPKMNVKGHRHNIGVIDCPPYFQPLDEPEPLPVSLDRHRLESFIESIEHARSPRPSVCDPKRFWLAVLVLDSITALRREALLTIVRPDRETLLVKRQIILTAEQAKNKRAEIIPLGTRDDVVALLDSLPSREGEPLLPWRWPDGRRLSLSHFNATMKRFQIAHGVKERLTTKHFRSTAATEILAEQYSTDTARKRLGHKSENVIRKNYQARVVTRADNDASDFLAKRVMDLLSKQPDPETLRISETG